MARLAIAHMDNSFDAFPSEDAWMNTSKDKIFYGMDSPSFIRISPVALFSLLRAVQEVLRLPVKEHPARWRKVAETFTVRPVPSCPRARWCRD